MKTFKILLLLSVFFLVSLQVFSQITGSGTTNYIPKFTGSTTIGNSALYQNSNDIGLGTTSPAGKLHLSTGTSGDCILRIEADTDNNDEDDNPVIQFHQDANITTSEIGMAGNNNHPISGMRANFLYLNNKVAAGIQFATYNTPRMTIDYLGKVGIGVTSPSVNMHIESDEDAAIYLEADNDDSGGEDDNPYIKFSQDNDANDAIIGMVGTDGYDPENVACNNTIADAFYIGTKATGDNSKLQLGTAGYVRMTFDGAGQVGINTTSPTATLSVNGSANKPGGGSWAVYSDKRLKKNIDSYSDGLNTLLKIEPITFQYNGKAGITDTEKKYVGIIAQDMQKIAPYMVQEVKCWNEKAGKNDIYLEFDPSALNYLIINSIKELNYKIERLENENEEMHIQLQTLGIEVNTNFKAILYQNNPNPFNETTEIKYSLSNDIQSAEIMIFDMNGTNLKTYKVDISENGKLTINANELKPGMYIYSLITDGKEVGTKRMIITE